MDRSAAIAPPAAPASAVNETTTPSGEVMGIRLLPIGQVHRNPTQPRQNFDEAALQTLARSISMSGLMQPIVVRSVTELSGGAQFQIIAGERRWRAAQMAGLRQIPAVVREVDDRTAAELSLIENLQREDLNPLERAEAFQRLITDFALTHQEIADHVGFDRSSISNHLRLLDLDETSKAAVRAGQLTLGHAKALLSITNLQRRTSLAERAIREEWSVRELERRAKALALPEPSAAQAAPPPRMTPAAANSADLAKRLGEHLGTKVSLHPGRQKGSGRLVIEFYTLDQFEGLMRQIGFEAE